MAGTQNSPEHLTSHAAAGRNSHQNGEPGYRRIVVKAGTNVLSGGSSRGGVDTEVMASLVDQIARLANADGIQVLLVTSGAIAAGRQALAERVAVPAVPDIPTRQVLAALGQSRLMSAYTGMFEQHGVVVSQVLLTIKDLAQRQAYLNIRNTLLSLLDLGIIPILNENDVVAADEIGEVFGDNDRLSSLIATLIDAGPAGHPLRRGRALHRRPQIRPHRDADRHGGLRGRPSDRHGGRTPQRLGAGRDAHQTRRGPIGHHIRHRHEHLPGARPGRGGASG